MYTHQDRFNVCITYGLLHLYIMKLFLIVALIVGISIVELAHGKRQQKDRKYPIPSNPGDCVELISHDSHCQGQQKCCSNGCGHECMDPMNLHQSSIKGAA
uniref:WAP four-disulfide core domain protein 18-like n=1 Tax=Myxine glutinosa TaxID=7769 RepID=UPI00358E0B2E